MPHRFERFKPSFKCAAYRHLHGQEMKTARLTCVSLKGHKPICKGVSLILSNFMHIALLLA